MPLVALIGPAAADQLEPVVNGLLGGLAVALCWILLGRLGVGRLRDRLALTVLFGLSTPIWWVAARGGVWHTGHLVAAVLTFAALVESFGRRRPLLLGMLAGAAFLSRAPLALAIPFFGWIAAGGTSVATLQDLARRWRRWTLVSLGVAPFFAFYFWYNAVRFGSPLESGYGLAMIPEWLEAERAKGLFSLAHLPLNLRYLLVEVPIPILQPPFLKPDGYGLSIALTSPGLAIAVLAPRSSLLVRALAVTALLVLIPSLLYYGGGWLQFGYRYALDSIPFVVAIAAIAAASRAIPRWGIRAIVVGVVVNLLGLYWVYNWAP
jgi:hypothetical protein